MALTTAVCICSALLPIRADIPWPEVQRRCAEENAKLARRPGGRGGEYYIVCTLYYTPKESGFTAVRGFDATPVTKPGLHGHKFARDFLRAVEKEGFGRLTTSVNGKAYLRFNRGAYAFSGPPTGGGGVLVPRHSAASRHGLPRGTEIETESETVKNVFGSTRWKIIDTGGGLRRWQVDCYWGEDEPRGPGHLAARPRGTEFEYAYAIARVVRN